METASNVVAVPDDEVEMELVSVMGILVPMEVTKGVSEEARHFAAGGASRDEVEEKVEDTNPVTKDYFHHNLNHTETKSDEVNTSRLAFKRNQKNRKKRMKRKQRQKNKKNQDHKNNEEPSKEKATKAKMEKSDSKSVGKNSSKEEDQQSVKTNNKKAIQIASNDAMEKDRACNSIATTTQEILNETEPNAVLGPPLAETQVENQRGTKKTRTTRKKFTTDPNTDTFEVETVDENEREEDMEQKRSEPSFTRTRITSKQSTKRKRESGLDSPQVEIEQMQKQSGNQIRSVTKKSVQSDSKSDQELTPKGQKEKPLEMHTSRLTRAKKAEEIVTAKEADTHGDLVSTEIKVDKPSQKSNYRTRADKKKSVETTSKAVSAVTPNVRIDDQTVKPNSARAHTAEDGSLKLRSSVSSDASSSAGNVEVSPTTRKLKQPLKRSRLNNEEDEPGVGSTKLLKTTKTAQSRMTETWKLDSDDEEQENMKLKNSKKSSTIIKTKELCSSSDQSVCTYPDCTHLAKYRSRCAEHNRRTRCSIPDCTKFAHTGGKCIAHGGGSRCTENGCDRRARSHGKCYAHGGGVLCSHPKCTTRAKSRGKCIAHGGGTVCSERGCNKLVIANGKCTAHGGWINCSTPGCGKRAQLRGKCIEHSELNVLPDTENEKLTKRFRRATIKPTETDTPPSDAKPIKWSKSVGVKKSADVETMRGTTLAKHTKMAAVETTKTELVSKELEDTTMGLRSGQRIKLVTRNLVDGYGALQSEKEALQMALKLSEVEY